MPRIYCLHTAEIHCATFGSLFAEASPEAEIVQEVRSDLLARARLEGLTQALTGEARALLESAAAAHDAVLVTCSTLGPIVSDMTEAHPNLVRIDTPLMQAAAATPGPTLVAFCLESTRGPTLALLDAAFRDAGRAPDRQVALCDAAWAHFERGETERFAASIAETVRAALDAEPAGCVALAQASMAVAAPLLADLDIPVFSSPRLAVEATLRAAR